VKIFNLRKINEIEFRKQYQIKISKMFAALEDLNDREHINDVKNLVKLSLGLYEIKQQKPWLDEKV
jgi:hypothetical protein